MVLLFIAFYTAPFSSKLFFLGLFLQSSSTQLFFIGVLRLLLLSMTAFSYVWFLSLFWVPLFHALYLSHLPPSSFLEGLIVSEQFAELWSVHFLKKKNRPGLVLRPSYLLSSAFPQGEGSAVIHRKKNRPALQRHDILTFSLGRFCFFKFV